MPPILEPPVHRSVRYSFRYLRTYSFSRTESRVRTQLSCLTVQYAITVAIFKVIYLFRVYLLTYSVARFVVDVFCIVAPSTKMT